MKYFAITVLVGGFMIADGLDFSFLNVGVFARIFELVFLNVNVFERFRTLEFSR